MKNKKEQIEEMAKCMGEKNFLCADDCENCIQIPCKCKLVKQSKMTDEQIKICLERMSNGKTSDVMNFDYTGTLSYIKRIESENVSLRARLDKAMELPFIHKVFVKDLRGNIQEDYQVVYLDDEDNFIYISTHTTKDSAEDFIAELKGNK